MIYPGAVWRPGANAGYRAGRNRMRLCVCHYTVGRLPGDLSVMDRGYFNFLVARDGTVYQGAEADALTWHAGTANPYGPGVEISFHPDYDDELWTPAAYKATGALVDWLIGLGIKDTFYDGDRIDPAGYEGFLTHRSVQQPDGHSDWWPDLPRSSAPKKDVAAMPLLVSSPSGTRVLQWPLFTGVSQSDMAALVAAGVPTVHLDNSQAGENVANAITAAANATLSGATLDVNALADAIVARLPQGTAVDSAAIAKAVRKQFADEPLH